jgi:hypothetical protein
MDPNQEDIMRLMGSLMLLMVAGSLAAQDSTRGMAAPTSMSNLTVTQAVLARSMADRTPKDTGVAFPADVGQLVFFTQFTAGDAPAASLKVHHVWFHGDKQVADVEVRPTGSPLQGWSRQRIGADRTGTWHVEIRDASGAVLKRVDFTVGQPVGD